MQVLLDLLRLEYWPIWVGAAVLLIAALFQLLTGRVPNAFTFSAVALAWLVALTQLVPGMLPPLHGGIVSSMAGTVAGLVMLLKAYKLGLGAGCLKAQMAFGAWVGCAMGLETALLAVVFATLLGQVALILIHIAIGRVRGDPSNDFVAAEQTASDAMLPAQATVAVGSIGGVMLFFVIGSSYLPHNQLQAAAAGKAAPQLANPPAAAALQAIAKPKG
jgi:hypothetical protein